MSKFTEDMMALRFHKKAQDIARTLKCDLVGTDHVLRTITLRCWQRREYVFTVPIEWWDALNKGTAWECWY
jgi:hypothetical protein